MAKRYEYEGLIYCEDDLSEEINNYGGDLFDLYYELQKDNKVDELTYYFVSAAYGDCAYYEDSADLIENEYEDLGIEVIENV